VEIEVPEVVSGTVGLVFIGLSFVASVIHNRKKQRAGS
jgi:hypothetical protein